MQAEELDDLVQRLAVAKYALSAHDERTAAAAIDAALESARRLMTDGHAGSLVRSRATPPPPGPPASPPLSP